jgi:hypothetical protein
MSRRHLICLHLLLLLLLLPILLPSPVLRGQTVFHVARDGNDSSPGTEPLPFASLPGARDAVRRLKAEGRFPTGGVTVLIHEGRYRLTNSFRLDSRDSGTQNAIVRYAAAAGEDVVLHGGVEIPPGSFDKVQDKAILERIIDKAARKNIVSVHLKKSGLCDSFAAILPRGFPHPVRPAPEELFFNGKPMTLARWPNDGFTKTGRVIDGGSVPRDDEKPDRPARFLFEGERPALWTDAPDAWLFGYWKFDWADETIAVAKIDGEKGEILLAGPHQYGVFEGKPFFAENLLEEIDRPGEYYLDRETGLLTFYPPAPIEGAAIVLSRLADPLILCDNASYVVFGGLILETSRGSAMHINGGEQIFVTGCTIKNLGARAILINGGKAHTVAENTICRTGEGGITLNGGDRRILEPGRHAVVDNNIFDFSRRTTTYRPAVGISGCGHRVAHNRMHHAPHSAIIFSGNDHLIEYNEIFDVLTRTGDGGAVYCGRDWSIRGTVIRCNLFHDIRGIGKWENAVYLDDQASGITVTDNLFVRCHWGMLVGGGRDNRIENNLFVDCRLALHFDARGLGWAAGTRPVLEERLAAVPFATLPWSERYPRLVDILRDAPMTPKGNVIRNNTLLRSGKIDQDMAKEVKEYGTVEGNVERE